MKILFVLLITFISITSEASERHGNRSWLGLFGKKLLENNYALWSEFQLRYDLNEPTMQQTLIRFGSLKKINKKNELGLLFGYIQTGTVKEYRPTLQHIHAFTLKPSQTLNLRNRLEVRFLENDSETALRYRGLLRFQKSLNNKLSLVVWDEPFINLTHNDWTGNRVFERNRFFIGPRLPFQGMHIEVGYMNQYVPRSNVDVIEHIFTAYLFY